MKFIYVCTFDLIKSPFGINYVFNDRSIQMYE